MTIAMFCHGVNNLQPGGGEKSLLRDLLLRVCSLHEMAAVSSLGPGCGRRRGSGVAQFRQKIRRLRLQRPLYARVGAGTQEAGRRALNFFNH
jgi:hypothetical protein